MTEKKQLIVAALAGLIALAWAFLPGLSKGYFMLMRFIVCFACVYMAWVGFKAKSNGWTWLLGGCAALYNPFVPVHLSPNIWLVANAFAVLLIASACWQLSRKRVERPASPSTAPSCISEHLSSAEDAGSQKNHQSNDSSHIVVPNPQQDFSTEAEPIRYKIPRRGERIVWYVLAFYASLGHSSQASFPQPQHRLPLHAPVFSPLALHSGSI